MVPRIKNVAIVTKIKNDLAKNAARNVAKFLDEKKVKVFSIEQLGANKVHLVDPSELAKTNLDLVFAIGGDGTTLRAFRIISKSTPVFSLNIGGTRGILAEANTKPIEQQLQDIFNGKYFYDKRLRLQANIDGKMVGAALNDIVITRTNLTKTPVVTIKVLDYPISQKMDGVIISTPTGSTGHALSLGGPIVHENMKCVMIFPIAPVNKTPALIVDINDIVISSTDSSKIIIDGQQVFDSKWKSNIAISRYPYDGVFLRIGKRGIRQLEKLGF